MHLTAGYRQPEASRLARLATRQHGVVAHCQLRALGYSPNATSRMVAAARLHRIHKGVYAVGHSRLTRNAHFIAAVFACGPDAVLSHHAAAALWDLRPTPQGLIDVTASTRRTHDGVRCHVTRSLLPGERIVIDAIPVTSLARTLLDYAEIANDRQLRAALEDAERREILDLRRIHATIAAHHGRRGIRPLTGALTELRGSDPPWLQSDLERAFRELLRAARLPLPSANVVVEGELVDCAWTAARLVAEVDGYGYHRSRRSFADDRRRDTKLQAAGWRVIRITEERMTTDAGGLRADLVRLLGA